MLKIIHTLLFWTLVLFACTPATFTPEATSPTAVHDTPATIPAAEATTELPPTFAIPTSTTEVIPPPEIVVTVSTPHIDQGPDGAVTDIPTTNPLDCGYQWAQQALPELSSQFLQSIQELQPAAQAYAFAFGENCVHADGTATFLPMETDFHVTLQVRDLSDKTVLGDWIVKVMQVIENIPAEQIIGPRPGRVSIAFESNGQQQFLNFYIDQYRSLSAGLSSAEIYQALQAPQ